MNRNVTLTIASLVSILLTIVHLADDVALGFEKGGVSYLIVLPILAIWLYGALVLADRRSGYVIMLLGSLLGMLIPFVHFRAPGGVAGSGFFFVWTLIALGVSAMFSLILSARGLLIRGQVTLRERA